MSDHTLKREILEILLKQVRHCGEIGLRYAAIDERSLTLELPYNTALIGDPATGVLHGGALTTLLDTTCGFSVPLALGSSQLCPTLDLRIDYMHAARPNESLFARAEVYRITEHVIFARGIAFQNPDQEPIAHCVATFGRLNLPSNPPLTLQAE